MIKPTTKIRLSKHAQERMVERFFNWLPIRQGKDAVRYEILELIRKGNHVEDWKRVPFYFNMINTKRGLGTEFVINGHMVFICSYNEANDVLTVVTAVFRMLYYPQPGTIAMGSPGGAKYYDLSEYLARLEVEAYSAYRQKFGFHPNEIWQHTQHKQAKLVKKPKPKPVVYTREEELQYKLDAIDRRLADTLSYTTQKAEELFCQRGSILTKLKKLTKDDEVRKYMVLISMTEADIMRAEQEQKDTSALNKRMRRYQNEISVNKLLK